MPPFSNSSDSFATIANESAPSWDSYRTGYNAAVRAGTIAPWVLGYFDITSAVESAFESGKWGGSDGVTPNYQAGDGKHESQAGALAIKASGVINPAVFTSALPPLQALSASPAIYPHGAAAGKCWEESMQVYVARLGGSGIYDDASRAHEIVGIFAVERFEDLFWMIDQACDPSVVEVAVLGAGGIYWEGQPPLKVPIATDDEGTPVDEFNGLPAAASICEEWHSPFYDSDGVKWRPVIKP